MEQYKVKVNSKEFIIEFDPCSNLNSIKEISVNGKKQTIDLDLEKLDSIVLNNNTHKINGIYDYDGEIVKILIGKDYHSVEVEELRPIKTGNSFETKKNNGLVKAPMPGKIIQIDVAVGETIKKGQDLLILEAMKMENRIKSPTDGILTKLNTGIGSNCNSKDLLMVIE